MADGGRTAAVAHAVKKAVIPAAGLGTRFLPATKAQPKEMLALVDKPAIQYVVEEAVQNGITDILVITGRGKAQPGGPLRPLVRAGVPPRADRQARPAGRDAGHRRPGRPSTIVRQGEPLGLGHAVSMAQAHVGDQPFVVMLADDIMHEKSGILAGMLARLRAPPAPRSWPSRRSRRPRSRRTAACAAEAVERVAGPGPRPRREAHARRRPRRTWASWAATCSPRGSSTPSPRPSPAGAARSS